MKNFKMTYWVFALVIGALLAVLPAYSQTGTAGVEGIVTDPQGAVVGGAKVTLTQTATNFSRSVETEPTGHYSFLSLQPGNYQMKVEKDGFRTGLRSSIALNVNTVSRVDVTLEVGQVTETVTITENAVTLNSQDASIGNVIHPQQVEALPMEARNIVALLSLQPGATSLPSGDMRSGSISGSRSDQTNITLDGVGINDEQNETKAYEPSLRVPADSVQEFRVTTSTYDATQGYSSAGQVAMVTKSGTNQIHGSGYWYHRNTATSSNPYFNKLQQLANGEPNKPPLLQKHIYGGTVGGPIKKDKLFFFFNYEARKDKLQQEAIRRVPSATMRDGILVYRCAVATDCPAANVIGVSGTSYPIADGYHGLTPAESAQIDPINIGPDLAALQYWNQFPLPNDPGRDGRNIMGYRFAAPILNKYNVAVTKIDYTLDSKGEHTLFWRGTYQHDRMSDQPQFPGQPPRQQTLVQPKGFALGYNAVLSQHVVNTFRWGYLHYNATVAGQLSGNNSTFRFLDTLSALTPTTSRLFSAQNFVDNISYTHGSHTFQFGGNIIFSRLPRSTNASSYLTAIANGSWVPGVGRKYIPGRTTCDTPGCTAVPAVATGDFAVYADTNMDLWGVLSQGNANYNYLKDGSQLPIGTPVNRRYASDNYEMYVQDSWRMKPSLTLTFGVHYSLFSPPWETNGLQVAPNPGFGEYYDMRMRGMEAGIPSNMLPRVSFDLAGPANGRLGYYRWDWNNFAPRVSAAWSPKSSNGILGKISGNGRLIVRGGYSQVYDRIGQALATQFDAEGAFGLSTQLTTPYASVTEATAPRWTSINSVPGYPLILPAPTGGFPAIPDQGLFAITSGVDTNLRTPYAHMIDFVVGRELPGNFSLEAGYVGRIGRSLLTKMDLSMPVNLFDPASQTDYFSAAQQIVKLAEAGDPIGFSVGTPVANIPTIPYWENMFPGIVGNPLCDVQGLGPAAYNTATKAIYDVYLCMAPDYTTALEFLDQGGLCDYYGTCSKFGPFAYFQDQFASLAAQSSLGYSNYHSLQITAKKKMSRGFQFDLNYTLSKSLDLTSEVERGDSFGDFFAGGYSEFVINSWNPRLSYAQSTFDMRHQLNMNWVWNLPFGHDQWLGKNANSWMDKIIGGWQFAGLWRWSSALPLNVINCRSCWATNWNLQGNAELMNGVLPPMATTKNAPGLNGYPSPFPNPQAALAYFRRQRPGEVGLRNVLRGDGYFNMDTSVSKVWKIMEGHTLQFRWETYNLTNTVKFDTGSLTATPDISSSFGRYNSTLSACDGAAGRCMQFGLKYQF